MIEIYLNGESTIISSEMTLKELLCDKKFIGQFAIAVNEVVIHKINYESIILRSQDRIEVITAMSGG